jgi:formylglycine-generating enzyme required for sulfatase activity
MQHRWNILLLASAIAAPMTMLAFVLGPSSRSLASPVPVPDLVELAPGTFRYRVSGEFTRDGKPVSAPIVTIAIKHTLAVMRHQVTAADYERCVAARACPRVSWWDASAYAAWLSLETGVPFRLPKDEEWAYMAGSRFNDDALPERAYASGPVQRALMAYERHASREEIDDQTAQPIGTFGMNENGIIDMAGNVWEWTDTCFTRNVIDERGEIATTSVNCGARVVEGRHRTYVTDFIRDARAGGCSIGTPASNLGFRLVRGEKPSLPRLFLEHVRRFFGLG